MIYDLRLNELYKKNVLIENKKNAYSIFVNVCRKTNTEKNGTFVCFRVIYLFTHPIHKQSSSQSSSHSIHNYVKQSSHRNYSFL